jgi:hypothetical protein
MMNSVLDKLDALSGKVEMIDTISESLEKLRSATLAMAVRVDATAEPTDTFVEEFQALL